MLVSIRGGMSMINKILTVIAFLGFMLEQVLNSSIPFRLLGVKGNVWLPPYINYNIDTIESP
ncbi:hypothetical protein [Clostridium sporogenes]|jgi:hypothetical protein|uniref:hypothetical protein n=2 Tax=Clostridium TaxID=1485 RepID=UPI00313A825F